MNLNPAEKNAIDVVDMLLRTSKVRVTRRTLRERLWQHPDFPSLVSLSDVLDELNVSNIATRLSPEQLPEIPLPALAYLETDGGLFALIRTVSADTVEWLHTKRGWQKQNTYEFDRIWNGVTLLIEPNRQSGEKKYSEQRRRERVENSRYPFIIVGVLACLSFFLAYSFQIRPLSTNGQLYTLVGLKLIGTIVSGFLLAYSFNSDNPLLRGICQLSNRTNCNSILNSQAAKLTDWLSWSEVGLLYFAGGFIAICLSFLIPSLSAIQALLWLNLLALPYTVYSIYYQAFVAKEFCLLCTTVQVILWIEFLVGQNVWGITSAKGIGLVIFAFTLVAILWAFIKQPLNQVDQVVPLQRELQKLKFNSEYIEGLFSKESTMPPIFDEMEVVTLGNPDAKHGLTIVTNPICRPCAIAHREIEKLLNITETIKCEIVFAPTNIVSSQVAQRILIRPADERGDALHQWFNQADQDVTKWNYAVKAIHEDTESDLQLQLHFRWRELSNVTRTPTIFLNGIEVPTLYHINDIAHLCKIITIPKELLNV